MLLLLPQIVIPADGRSNKVVVAIDILASTELTKIRTIWFIKHADEARGVAS